MTPDGPPRSRFSLRRRSAEAPAAPAARVGPPTVLVVDDVESIRILVRTALEPEFHVIGEAANGDDAARTAEALQPDLVVLDLNMPRHDGLEALAPIRLACPGARIVVLSGLPPEVIADKAIELGADRFVDKSAPLAELQGVLRDVLAE